MVGLSGVGASGVLRFKPSGPAGEFSWLEFSSRDLVRLDEKGKLGMLDPENFQFILQHRQAFWLQNTCFHPGMTSGGESQRQNRPPLGLQPSPALYFTQR